MRKLRFLAGMMSATIALSVAPVYAFEQNDIYDTIMSQIGDSPENLELKNQPQMMSEDDGVATIASGDWLDVDWAVGGQIQFDSSTGAITSAEETITSVTIPSEIGGVAVTSIGSNAFLSCSSLESVVIGDSVTSIGVYAFDMCSSLKSVVIPDSVTSMNVSAFGSCSSLESIIVNENNANYSSQDGNLFNKDKTELIQYARGKTATSYSIPDSVTSIGDRAFSGCSSLESVVIPDSVTSIGDSAFSSCSSLESVVIPNSVTSIGISAFVDCSSLKSVEIPSSITFIDYAVFDNCGNLTNVYYTGSEDEWNEIGIIFPEFSSLTNATIHYNSSMPDFEIDADGWVTADWIVGGRIKFDSSTGAITDAEETITSVTIPSEIGGVAVTSIGDEAFYWCSSLASVVIPDSVTLIGDEAFRHCSSLESVVIPDSVTSIGNDAFRHCSSLESVVIPDSVTSIGDYAFEFCSSLESVVIPDSVTSIGDYAFSGCSSLASVTIPDSVTSIGYWAFGHCSSLESITVNENNANYSSQDGNLFNKDKTELIQYAIGHTRTSYNIPDSVTSIGEWAFSKCSSLASVTIPDSVTSIGYWAFEFCRSLESVVIGDSVTLIGEGTFYGCSSLASVEIPDSVTSIGYWAFGYCSNLTNIYYTGSENEWNAISIGSDNDDLTNATIHYNSSMPVDEDMNVEYAELKNLNPYIYYFVGEDVTPRFDVVLNDITLKKDRDYTVTYANNQGIGTGIVYIDGIGDYEGQYVSEFEILDGTGVYVLPDATENTVYYANLKYTISPDVEIISGVLPNGLELLENASIFGVPTENGAFIMDAVYGEDSIKLVLYVREILDLHDEEVELEFEEDLTDFGYEIIVFLDDEIDLTLGYDYTFESIGEFYQFLDVYFNGVKLIEGVDYIAEEGSTRITVNRQTFADQSSTTSKNVIQATFLDPQTSEIKIATQAFEATKTTTGGSSSNGNSSSGSTSGNSSSGSTSTETEDTTIPKVEEVTPETLLHFTDVFVTDWFYGAVKFAVEKGLFVGTSETLFSPNDNMSRAMIWTVLYRFDGQEGVTTGANWYEETQKWAIENGISDGENPENDMTREQFAVLLYRYSGQPEVEKTLNSNENISSWAEDAMNWAVNEGLILGDTNGNLNPTNSTTRAEVSTILMRYIQE